MLITHSVVGSIGTSNPIEGRVPTHEMGHFFGLFHVFESANQPGQIDCSYSDGIYDTPHCSYNGSCMLNLNTCDDTTDPVSFNYWGYDVIDNVQNFMTYSYCFNMFTKGQAAMMRAVHENPIYGRWSLSDSANLVATGVGPGVYPVSTAVPGSDFAVPYNTLCVGDSLYLINTNGNPVGVTYQWSFPGGNSNSPATAYQPAVSYDNPGYYPVSLTAQNANGQTTTSHTDWIYVSGNWAEYLGPTVLDLDSSGAFWQSFNASLAPQKFTWIPNRGVNNSGCFRLAERFDTTGMGSCAPVNQIQGNKYRLITPAFDLNTTSSVTVSFDYAYGSSASPMLATETLKVYSSRNCGESWLQKKSLSDTALITGFCNSSSNFEPTTSQWKTATFIYTPNGSDNKTRFKFEFTAANESNFLYIDNFKIDGVLGISEHESAAPTLYPNPLAQNELLILENLLPGSYQINVVDLQGKTVYENRFYLDKTGEFKINPELKAGYYLLKIDGAAGKYVYKIVIE